MNSRVKIYQNSLLSLFVFLLQHSFHSDSSCYCTTGPPVFTGDCGRIQRSLCRPAARLQTGTVPQSTLYNSSLDGRQHLSVLFDFTLLLSSILKVLDVQRYRKIQFCDQKAILLAFVLLSQLKLKYPFFSFIKLLYEFSFWTDWKWRKIKIPLTTSPTCICIFLILRL